MSVIKAENLTLGYQREEPVIVNASFEIRHKDFMVDYCLWVGIYPS